MLLEAVAACKRGALRQEALHCKLRDRGLLKFKVVLRLRGRMDALHPLDFLCAGWQWTR